VSRWQAWEHNPRKSFSLKPNLIQFATGSPVANFFSIPDAAYLQLLQYTRFPIIPLNVAQVTLLLIYGWIILRSQPDL
jgi:hypothetical protein